MSLFSHYDILNKIIGNIMMNRIVDKQSYYAMESNNYHVINYFDMRNE